MASQVVTYQVDESTTIGIEIEPAAGFRPAGPQDALVKVREAVGPAVEAAKVVMERVREANPDQVELRFGVKASGGANWLVAKAVGEANFEVTLRWSRSERKGSPAAPRGADTR